MDVRFDAVSLCYASGHRALNSVTLTIASGQFCVILGRSGAGKSSLLRTVNGLAVATSGSVAVGGVEVAGRRLRALRRRISMVHQDFALVGRASVAHNIVSGAAADMPAWRVLLGHPSPQHRERVLSVAQAVGLEPAMMVRRADKLSGGQQQRVGIARALILDPTVILVDEPVSSLDPHTARDILTLLKEQARATGATVICSLHQPDLARDFADRIVGLDAGRIAFDCAADRFGGAEAAEFYRDALPRLMVAA